MNPLAIGASLVLIPILIIVFVVFVNEKFTDGPGARDPYFWPNTYSHWYAGLRGKAERGLPYMP